MQASCSLHTCIRKHFPITNMVMVVLWQCLSLLKVCWWYLYFVKYFQSGRSVKNHEKENWKNCICDSYSCLSAYSGLSYNMAFMASVKPTIELSTTPFALPKVVTFENFIKVFSDGKIGIYMWNSLKVTGISLILIIFLSSTVGYALSKFRIRGKNKFINFLRSESWCQYRLH